MLLKMNQKSRRTILKVIDISRFWDLFSRINLNLIQKMSSILKFDLLLPKPQKIEAICDASFQTRNRKNSES